MNTTFILIISIILIILVISIILIILTKNKGIKDLDLAPKMLIFLRHGEKPEDQNSPEMTCQGYKRGVCIANNWINGKYKVEGESIPLPDWVFACPGNPNTDPNTGASKSKRSIELAKTIVTNVESKKSDIKVNYNIQTKCWSNLIDQLGKTSYDNSTVLIIWEHNNINDMFNFFGFNNYNTIKDTSYDDIKIIYMTKKNIKPDGLNTYKLFQLKENCETNCCP